VSICVLSKLYKNDWADSDAVWRAYSREPSVPCIRWGSRSPHSNGHFWRVFWPIVKYSDFCVCQVHEWPVQKWLNWSWACLGGKLRLARGTCITCGSIIQILLWKGEIFKGTCWLILTYQVNCVHKMWKVSLGDWRGGCMAVIRPLLNYFGHLLGVDSPLWWCQSMSLACRQIIDPVQVQ